MSLKEKILELRKSGKKYVEISELLDCSIGVISYHCNQNSLAGNYVSKTRNKLTEIEIDELNVYYKEHTIKECMIKFDLCKSTVTKYTENKFIRLSDEELKLRNYHKVKSHRQKLKHKAIEYKGGCCEKCGYDRCNTALEFHHLDPSKKDFGIGSYTVLSWVKIKDELDKCIIVCANCHREIHDGIIK